VVKQAWIFCPLDSSIRKEDFDCGILELNDYLRKYAKQNDTKGVAKTFVAIADTDDRVVLGYYSVSMAELQRESLPEAAQKRLPGYPIPVMRLGRLAVDRSIQGQGLGKQLLMECFARAVRLSPEIGIVGVMVDASNQQAKEFYLKYGFIPLNDKPMSLFISLSTLKAI
jgi:GNAT superfamily N-acetyltransferase